jgi:alkyl hydroperoxide reductase subunit AhpC
VGKAYGVFSEERGMDKRSAFIVDGDGKIRWAKEYAPGTIPESAELLAELRKL